MLLGNYWGLKTSKNKTNLAFDNSKYNIRLIIRQSYNKNDKNDKN